MRDHAKLLAFLLAVPALVCGVTDTDGPTESPTGYLLASLVDLTPIATDYCNWTITDINRHEDVVGRKTYEVQLTGCNESANCEVDEVYTNITEALEERFEAGLQVKTSDKGETGDGWDMKNITVAVECGEWHLHARRAAPLHNAWQAVAEVTVTDLGPCEDLEGAKACKAREDCWFKKKNTKGEKIKKSKRCRAWSGPTCKDIAVEKQCRLHPACWWKSKKSKKFGGTCKLFADSCEDTGSQAQCSQRGCYWKAKKKGGDCLDWTSDTCEGTEKKKECKARDDCWWTMKKNPSKRECKTKEDGKSCKKMKEAECDQTTGCWWESKVSDRHPSPLHKKKHHKDHKMKKHNGKCRKGSEPTVASAESEESEEPVVDQPSAEEPEVPSTSASESSTSSEEEPEPEPEPATPSPSPSPEPAPMPYGGH